MKRIVCCVCSKKLQVSECTVWICRRCSRSSKCQPGGSISASGQQTCITCGQEVSMSRKTTLFCVPCWTDRANKQTSNYHRDMTKQPRKASRTVNSLILQEIGFSLNKSMSTNMHQRIQDLERRTRESAYLQKTNSTCASTIWYRPAHSEPNQESGFRLNRTASKNYMQQRIQELERRTRASAYLQNADNAYAPTTRYRSVHSEPDHDKQYIQKYLAQNIDLRPRMIEGFPSRYTASDPGVATKMDREMTKLFSRTRYVTSYNTANAIVHMHRPQIHHAQAIKCFQKHSQKNEMASKAEKQTHISCAPPTSMVHSPTRSLSLTVELEESLRRKAKYIKQLEVKNKQCQQQLELLKCKKYIL